MHWIIYFSYLSLLNSVYFQPLTGIGIENQFFIKNNKFAISIETNGTNLSYWNNSYIRNTKLKTAYIHSFSPTIYGKIGLAYLYSKISFNSTGYENIFTMGFSLGLYTQIQRTIQIGLYYDKINSMDYFGFSIGTSIN